MCWRKVSSFSVYRTYFYSCSGVQRSGAMNSMLAPRAIAFFAPLTSPVRAASASNTPIACATFAAFTACPAPRRLLYVCWLVVCQKSAEARAHRAPLPDDHHRMCAHGSADAHRIEVTAHRLVRADAFTGRLPQHGHQAFRIFGHIYSRK